MLAVVLPAAAAAASSITYTEISDEVVIATSRPFAANSLLVRTKDGTVILVDTPTTPRDTQELLDWTRGRWGSYPTTAVNSHWHFDATGGNQVLLENGVQVIASATTNALLRERGARALEEMLSSFAESDPAIHERLADLRPTPADRAVEVSDRVVLRIGGEEVWLVYPGPSHSSDSIAVFFPGRRLLYGGCAVRSDGKFVNRREADFESWAAAVEELAALRPLRVVPGHGIRFDSEMLQETIEAARIEASTASKD